MKILQRILRALGYRRRHDIGFIAFGGGYVPVGHSPAVSMDTTVVDYFIPSGTSPRPTPTPATSKIPEPPRRFLTVGDVTTKTELFCKDIENGQRTI